MLYLPRLSFKSYIFLARIDSISFFIDALNCSSTSPLQPFSLHKPADKHLNLHGLSANNFGYGNIKKQSEPFVFQIVLTLERKFVKIHVFTNNLKKYQGKL